MAKKHDDDRDVFEKALDWADRNPAAVGAAAIGALGARGFRKIAKRHGDSRIGATIAGGAYGGVLGGAAGGMIGLAREKQRKRRKK